MAVVDGACGCVSPEHCERCSDADPRQPLGDEFTAAQLIATTFSEPKWAVPGLIPEGLTLIAGKPKVGKSWLCLDIAMTISTGAEILGEYAVNPGDALYLALEDQERRLQDRIRVLAGAGVGLERLTIRTRSERIDRGGRDHITRWLAMAEEPRLVVIDTWARFRPKGSRRGNAYDHDYQSLEPLQNLASDEGISILVVHHFRKLEAEDWVDEVAGTTGLAAAADNLMGLFRSRGEAQAVLHVTGRDIEEISLALHFDRCRWVCLGDAQQYEMSATRLAITRLITEAGPSTPSEVADGTSITQDNARQTMRRMEKDGQLACRSGTYSLPPLLGPDEGKHGGEPVTPVTGVT